MLYEKFKNRDKVLKRYGIENGIKRFTFENVIAEDTCVDGEDIDLGTLTFEVNFLEHKWALIEGSNPRKTGWDENSFHPHQLSENSICLGSQDSDMVMAINGVEVEIVQAILHKFAHSYTSTDSAGRNWVKWTDNPGTVWSEYHDEDIELSEAIQTENEDWIFREESVTLDDGRVFHEDSITYCEYHDESVYHEEAVYCPCVNSFVHQTKVVELADGHYAPLDLEGLLNFEDNFYTPSQTVEDIHGEIVPLNLCVYSHALGKYILIVEAIHHTDGNYYTSDTLPQPEVVETPGVTVTNEPVTFTDGDFLAM